MSTCSKVLNKTVKIYIFATIFVAVFGYVYEYFGHGAHSMAMSYAFLYPLVLGLLASLMLSRIGGVKKSYYRGYVRAGLNLFHAGVATLTAGSILLGIVEIFGTTYKLLFLYTVVGCTFYGVGIILSIIGFEKERRIRIKEKSKKNSK